MRSTRSNSPTTKALPTGRALVRLQGAVLLEVVLALGLFVAAAAVVSASLNASLESVDRLRLNLHAVNLAVSVLSELQLGTRAVETGSGPQPFEPPFEQWGWEVFLTPLEGLGGI